MSITAASPILGPATGSLIDAERHAARANDPAALPVLPSDHLRNRASRQSQLPGDISLGHRFRQLANLHRLLVVQDARSLESGIVSECESAKVGWVNTRCVPTKVIGHPSGREFSVLALEVNAVSGNRAVIDKRPTVPVFVLTPLPHPTWCVVAAVINNIRLKRIPAIARPMPFAESHRFTNDPSEPFVGFLRSIRQKSAAAFARFIGDVAAVLPVSHLLSPAGKARIVKPGGGIARPWDIEERFTWESLFANVTRFMSKLNGHCPVLSGDAAPSEPSRSRGFFVPKLYHGGYA